MDFKAEEKIFRDKLHKKKSKTIKKSKLNRKSIGLGLGMTPEIKEVESSENSDNDSEGDSKGGRNEHFTSPTRGNDKKSAERSDRKSDLQGGRSKKTQELKQTWKAGHVMSNILLLLLKEIDYERLQQYSSLVNILYTALSTDISQKFRQKERAKVNIII